MSRPGYTLLGWIVWRIGVRVARRKLRANRRKLVAGGVVALVIAGGVAAARTGEGSG